MAFKLVDIKSDQTSYFVADGDIDVQDLPTNVSVGSTCLVIGDGTGSSVYMLNNQNEWIKI